MSARHQADARFTPGELARNGPTDTRRRTGDYHDLGTLHRHLEAFTVRAGDERSLGSGCAN
jgi:hypothetical protein